jgi:opacity protein-like surface antigen
MGIAILSVLTATREAAAQSDHGPLAAGLVSAAVADDETAPSFSGYVGYRFNRVFGLGIEVTSIQALDEPPLFVIAGEAIRASGGFGTTIFPPPYRFEDADSDLTVFTTNVRLEVPTTTRRLTPYVTAGGGLANLNTSYRIIYSPLAFTNPLTDERISLPTIPSDDVSSSALFMAVTLGGGASVMCTDRLAVDIDARALSLLGYEGRTIGRFGVGLSYRF